MRRALEYVKAFGGVVAQHAQEPRLTEDAQMNEGELSGRLGLRGWPAVAEEAIIARDCLLAAHVGSRLHVCHVSTAGSVEIVRWAKEKGWDVTAEVCPHHLILTDELAATYDPIYKVNPPLRSAADVEALGPAWPTAPSTSSPPTTRPTRTRTRTASGRPRRSACSASRPPCRSCRRPWSTPGCSTGPRSPSGCPSPRRGSAGWPSTVARSRSASPPTSCSTTHRYAGGRLRRGRLALAEHAVRRDGAARPGGRVPARHAHGHRREVGNSRDPSLRSRSAGTPA